MANKAYRYTDPNAASKVIRAALASPTDIDGGALQETPGTETWGPFAPNGDQWIQWTPSAGEQTALLSTIHVHFEVQSTAFSKLAALGGNNNRMMTLAAGGHKAYLANGQVNISLDGGVNNFFSNVNKDDRSNEYTAIDIIIDGSGQTTYVDNVLVGVDTATLTTGDVATINLAASQIGTEVWGDLGTLTEGFQNLYIYSAEQVVEPVVEIGITGFGDSFMEQGSYSAAFLVQDANQDNDGLVTFGDQGMMPTIERGLANNGINYNWRCHAAPGDSITSGDLATQVAAAADMTGRIAIVGMGTNDANIVINSTFKTNYQAGIDAIFAKGATEIYIWTVPTRKWADPPNAALESQVDAVNSVIRELISENPNVYLWDAFGYLGGHDAPESFFASADATPHPSITGSRAIGESFVYAYASIEGISDSVFGGVINATPVTPQKDGASPVTPVGGLSGSVIGVSPNEAQSPGNKVLSVNQTVNHAHIPIGADSTVPYAINVSSIAIEVADAGTNTASGKGLQYTTANADAAPGAIVEPNADDYTNETDPAETVPDTHSVFAVEP